MPTRPPPPLDESKSAYPPPPPPNLSIHPQAATGWATGSIRWATFGTGDRVELASPGDRLAARVIDSTILGVVGVLFLIFGVGLALGIADGDTATDEEAGVLVLALVVLVLLAGVIFYVYEVTLIATKGQTLGKMATRIKVVGAHNGLVPGWGRSMGRSIIRALAGFVPFLSLVVDLSLLWDENRQGWHDKAAGTLVVKA